MFDKKDRIWVSDCTDQELMRWSREPVNMEKPEAKFLRASDLLSKHSQGSEAAEAVLLMEQSAKEGYPPAVFAMGQMFQWGWAVHNDKKQAMKLYRQAAALGYGTAAKILAEYRRKKIISAASVCAAVLVCVLAVIGIIQLTDTRSVIHVHKDTQLIRPATLEEYSDELSTLVTAYDDELVISGQVSTNRLILRFEGSQLDLEDFLADKVIARQDNVVIIQFISEEEARRCLDELNGFENIIYVEMDEYAIVVENTAAAAKSDVTVPKDLSVSCYSWGVADMGLDELSAFVASKYPDRSVLVAVIDTGALIGSEFADRGSTYNVRTGGKAVPHEHGTHTTGIVLDGTRGTSVQVLNIDCSTLSNSLVELAYQHSIDIGADVINMSLGITGSHTASIEDAIKRAVSAGIVVVNAAGNNADSNDGTNQFSCPAELTESIVVAAYDQNHNMASFTSYGSTVDVAAPGVEVYSQYYGDDGRLIAFDGTSMAAPHVAALAALVRILYPNATPDLVQLYIKDYCRNTNPAAYDTGLYGAGAPDATAFIEYLPE